MPTKPRPNSAPHTPPAEDADRADLALLQQIQAGGPEARAAWTSLLARYQDRLYAICLRMVSNPDHAADLTQDSMVKIVQGLATYDARSKLSTWMVRVTMNTCLSWLRSQRLRRHASLDSLLDQGGTAGASIQSENGTTLGSNPTPDAHSSKVREKPGTGSPKRDPTQSSWAEQTRELSPTQSVQLDERRHHVAAALAALPSDQRAILLLRDVQDLDYEQIAQVLDVNVGTVKSRLFRARLALRQAVEAMETPTAPPDRRSPAAD